MMHRHVAIKSTNTDRLITQSSIPVPLENILSLSPAQLSHPPFHQTGQYESFEGRNCEFLYGKKYLIPIVKCGVFNVEFKVAVTCGETQDWNQKSWPRTKQSAMLEGNPRIIPCWFRNLKSPWKSEFWNKKWDAKAIEMCVFFFFFLKKVDRMKEKWKLLKLVFSDFLSGPSRKMGKQGLVN